MDDNKRLANSEVSPTIIAHSNCVFDYIVYIVHNYLDEFLAITTVEPPSKGHFGANHFVPCREVVLFSEVENVLHTCICFWGYGRCPL